MPLLYTVYTHHPPWYSIDMNTDLPAPPPGYRWKLAIDPWYADGLRAYYLELRRLLPVFSVRRDQYLVGSVPDDVDLDTLTEAAYALLERHAERETRDRFNNTIRSFNDNNGRDK